MRKTIVSLWLIVTILGLVLLACGQPRDKFAVLSFEVEPQQIIVGDEVTVKATISNIDGEDKVFDIALMVNNVAENRDIVAIPSDGTEEVVFSLVEHKAGNYKIAIGDKSTTLVVLAVPPPEFHIFEFEINPTKVVVGDKVVICGKVKNTGGSKGSYVAQLMINDQQREAQTVNLKPGEDILVIFSFVDNEPGTYVVTLGDSEGTYEVTEPVEPTRIKKPPVRTPTTSNSRCCSPGG